MKKLLTFAVAALIGFGVVSCSDDDDATPSEVTMVVWKAETVSYTFGGQTHTYPYNVDGGPFAGCDVDLLTLISDNSAVLEEHLKNADDDCETILSVGTWTDSVIHVKDVDRQVVSKDDNEMVLTYPLTFYGSTMPITVAYSKQ